MPSAKVDVANPQGGKAYGKLMEEMETRLDETNKGFIDDDFFKDVEELPEKLEAYKLKFIECDRDRSGDLDMMDVKYMLEKLGQAKTHLELKKMIQEVDTTNTGAINYVDFVKMMLGPKSSVLKLILMFEGKAKADEKPVGLPPKRDISSLP
ncbi:allograft inflammatory factor 1-like [Haliotis rufescens]|uniref:allograft inflammatory factor 1-like n=1 Tax=Haliotis rufescens TaxID=6454 RepID=UPI001EAFD096|nr:allograft inflammatory factor 1-like [Haliotis rufescens]